MNLPDQRTELVRTLGTTVLELTLGLLDSGQVTAALDLAALAGVDITETIRR